MADGKIVFEVTADGKHAIADIKDITKQIDKETKKWDNAAEDAADGTASAWDKAVGSIVGKLTAAGVVAIFAKWGKAAIEAASDLEEVQNVVDVTFGDSAGKIESWAKKAGKQYGLTETAAKKYTSTIGAMLKSQGMADDEIVQTSTDLAGLAADMASFYNLDFDEAFQKIRSGISGETEPLKQLGINMSAANLEAFRLSKGIEKAYSAMSQSEQTALRYQYIMQATADAQGDFARTADGYANASRRMETAMDTIKTKGGKLLLEVVEPLASGLASILETLTAEDTTTALDDIASIDEKTGQKVSNIQKTAIDAGYLADELAALASKAELTGDEQSYWLETCKRLVQTIPGLSSIINTETGEIKGGTDAVKEYIKAWEEGQTKLAMLGAIQQKENALASRFSDLPGLQLDAAVEARRARTALSELQKVYEKYRVAIRFDANGHVNKDEARNVFGLSKDALKEIEAVTDAFNEQADKAKEANDAYVLQANALEEARAALEEYKQTVEEMPGDTEAATEALEAWKEAAQAVGPTLLESAKQAIEAMADYVEGIRNGTEQAVNSVVKGFDKITRPTTDLEEKRSRLIEQQNALNRSTEEGAKKYDELQKQIEELNKSIDEYSASGMQDGLKSQIAFMDEYIKNLEKAKSLGLSDELLASLSDGSVQSAEYLANLVANPAQAAEVDALYQEVQKKKEEFTDALTEQKLAADETYQSMVETAQAAIEQLDLGQQAEDAMESTVEGLATGLAMGVPALSDAVTAVIQQLNRLSAYGISVSVPTFGNLMTAGTGGVGQYANLGSGGINYDLLGSVIGANGGGNVYLDGRKVGDYVTGTQTREYKAQERSGWRQP